MKTDLNYTILAIGSMCLASEGWLAAVSLRDNMPACEMPALNSITAVHGITRFATNAPPKLKPASGLRWARVGFLCADGTSVGNQATTNYVIKQSPDSSMPVLIGNAGHTSKTIPLRNGVFSATNQTNSAPPIVMTNTFPMLAKDFPEPGIYAGTPYSGLIFVPEPIDSAFVVVPPNSATMDHCYRVPELQLEPKN